MNSDNTFLSAVENLCGGAWFTLVGDEDTYENIKHWYVGNGNLTDESKIPTKEQVLAEVERIKKESMVWDYEKRENIHVFVSDPNSKHFDGYLARL